MFVRTWFDSLKSRLSRSPTCRSKGVADRRLAARRLLLEGLEERRLLAFDLAVNYPAGMSPQDVITADFNNDGRLDVATANGSSVSVLLGNADGTFQPAQNSTMDFGLGGSMTAGDFNSDGNLDLVNANADYVIVMLGNGHGDLQQGGAFILGSYANAVAVADFNGDGKLDLGVTSNDNGAYANVLLGDGAGSFAAPIAHWLGFAGHGSVALADFNGDGKQDYASVNDDGYVSVLLGAGNGTLGEPSTFSVGAYPGSVTAGDVNADGKIDLVTLNTNAYSNNIGVMLGDGLGSFGFATNYSAGFAPGDVAMADFNGDVNTDLVATNPSAAPSALSVLLGSGAGVFNPALTVENAAGPFHVAVGDFNGDGRPDAVSANTNSNNVSVLLNDGVWPALDNPSIVINGATVTEGNVGTVNAAFTVTLSAASSQDVTVRYATADYFEYYSSATAGSDYETQLGQLTIPAGQTSATINVSVYGDRLGEGTEWLNESFLVNLTDPINAFIADGTGVGTIIDDEPTASIDFIVTGDEGNTGTTPFVFTVTLSAPYDVPVTVEYATADLTPDQEYLYGPGATAGIDYTATSGTLTIPAGQISGTITVLVSGDRVGEGYEFHEMFTVNLSDASGARLTYRESLGAIYDDEPFVSINGEETVVEGNSGTTAMSFTVSLSAVYDADVTVSYATADRSALAGSDYVAAIGTVTIPSGQMSQTLTVLVNGDLLAEGNEEFVVTLTSASRLFLYDTTGFATILNDDTLPAIAIGDVTVTEGNTGTRAANFTVALSTLFGQPVTIAYVTTNGTATSDDYQAASGTLTIPAGQTTGTITVLVKGDRLGEPNETFFVNVSNPTNAIIADGQGVGTILDDEPRNSINNVTKAEGKKNQTTLFTFTVTLSAPYDQPVTMSFQTVNGTARTSNSDYVAKSGTLTFAPGESTKTITIEVKGDSKKEANETFYLDLFGNSSNSSFTKYRGIGTILNDD
jgi:hypothetical protein